MGTVVGSWRIKLTIFLIFFIMALYTMNGLFLDIETDEHGFIQPEQDFDYESEQGKTFTDNIYALGLFLTFGNIDNVWIRLLFNLIIACCWITIAYIIYTYVKEWVPLT